MSRGADIDLSVRLHNLVLPNPVMPASGTFDLAPENTWGAGIQSKLGALVCKSVTLTRQQGNPPPRVSETAAGMINAVGIPSAGIDHFVQNQLPLYLRANDCVIISVSGKSVEEFREIVQILDSAGGISGIELNLSCPNLGNGIPYATDKKLLQEAVSAAREVTAIPLIAKLSPNVTCIAEMACAAEEAGADVASLINTLSAMVIDVESRKPLLGNTVGGLSGPAIKPVAVRMVWDVYKAVNIPIIGMGGIVSGKDAVEFMLAGAAAVAVGTSGLRSPSSLVGIVQEISDYLEKHGFDRVMDLVGLAHKSG